MAAKTNFATLRNNANLFFYQKMRIQYSGDYKKQRKKSLRVLTGSTNIPYALKC